MKKEDIKTLIQNFAVDSFENYPSQYPKGTNGIITDEANQELQLLANYLWTNRNDAEITRDYEGEVTEDNYNQWVAVAYVNYLIKTGQ